MFSLPPDLLNLFNPRDAPVLRWGILGPGIIAAEFVRAIQQHTDQRVVAIGSRTFARASEFADAHGVGRAYGSYEELVADPEIDVVYIATPHSHHAMHAILSISAGKHVLIEKPMAATATEAQVITDAARRAGVFAMEAMWTRYRPQSLVLGHLLQAGVIGDPRVVTADFGITAIFDPKSRLFDPELAGGALLDLGVYAVSWASGVLGTPSGVVARGQLAPTGVDLQAAIILTGSDGAQALLSTSLNATTSGNAHIAGGLGRIEIDSPFWRADSLRVFDQGNNLLWSWQDELGRPVRESLCYQAAALARFVSEGLTESPLHTLDEAVATLSTIDEARRQLGHAVTGTASS